MKRDYSTGIAEQVIFFKGKEVEHTPTYGMDTLFVTGIQSVNVIESHLGDIKHIFFGANHSFNPVGYDEHKAWEEMITHFLEKCFWCTLDIPMNQVEEFNEGGLNDFDMFIPQIRVPIPYIKLWNYNTMLKIDDKDFNATNPGVWTHKLHDLKDRSKFTSWDMYNNDTIIK
jgi:hypothetical protein